MPGLVTVKLTGVEQHHICPLHTRAYDRRTRLNVGMGHDVFAGLLAPAWQVAIAILVLVVTVLAGRTLARRGRSRMNRAMVVTGATVIGLVTVMVLLTNH